MAFKRFITKIYSPSNLFFTNTVTGVISITIGDCLQQNLEYYWDNSLATGKSCEKKEPFKWNSYRTGNMMVAGVYFSMFGHWWYSFLDRKFPPKTKNSVTKKLLAESISGPLIVTSVFVLFGKINGQKWETTWYNIKTNFNLICAAEWLVFLPIQWVNFTFVPAAYRYLYVATVSIGYDAFLSYVFHRNDRYKKQRMELSSHLSMQTKLLNK